MVDQNDTVREAWNANARFWDARMAEGNDQDRGGEVVTTYSVKVSRYLTPYTQAGLAFHDQPMPHPYFHRPLGRLLGECFDARLVLDALEEPAFPPNDTGGSTPLSWNGRFSELPPVLVARMKRYETRST